MKIISPNVCLLSDTAAANERLQVPLSLHNFRKYTRAEEVDGTRIHASRKRNSSLCVPGYRDLRPRGLQVQFRQYHCLPSGRRGGRRCAEYPEGHGAVSAVREYDPQQVESYTGG